MKQTKMHNVLYMICRALEVLVGVFLNYGQRQASCSSVFPVSMLS